MIDCWVSVYFPRVCLEALSIKLLQTCLREKNWM
jgi:hypothetical protein